jgi:hypothetical protein
MFSKANLLYAGFIIMSLDAKFNSEQNGVTVKLTSENI